MSQWKKVKLKDICLSISDGDHLPPPKTDHGIPFITISNIDSSNHLDFSSTLFVSQEYYDTVDDKRKAKPGDILYSVVGSFGKPVLIKENKPFAFQRHIAILRPDNDIVDSAFMYYAMMTYDFYMQADSVALGAAQRTISLGSLRDMTVEVPSKEVQQHIANTLSQYDTLIENYQQQIKLLEEAAQRLYKEWFVDLHFPGYENTKIVDGVPEGWEIGKAIDYFPITIGRTPPRKERDWFSKENGIPWVSISDMKSTSFIGSTNEFLTEDAVKCFNIKVVPYGTVLLSFKLTVGRACITQMQACTNEAIAHFVTDSTELRYYTLLYLRNFKYDSLGNTSGISKAINSTIVKNMPFILPSIEVLRDFSKNITPLMERIGSLTSQLRLLTEARDRLLPKLMSGEIEV